MKGSHSEVLTSNLVDPASCHMLVSRTKPCKCESTRGFPREVCVRLIKRFIVSPTKDVHLPALGITLLTAKLIPVRKTPHFPNREVNFVCLLVVWGALRRNKNQRRFRQLTLLRQANVAKAFA